MSTASLRGLAPPPEPYYTLESPNDFVVTPRRSGWNLLLWLLILTAIFWVIWYLIRPTFIRQTSALGVPTDQIDQWKLFFVALASAIVVLALLYLLKIVRA